MIQQHQLLAIVEENNKEVNLHYKNRQPEKSVSFVQTWFESERKKDTEREKIVITRAYKHQVWRRFTCAREGQARYTKPHTHTPTELQNASLFVKLSIFNPN